MKQLQRNLDIFFPLALPIIVVVAFVIGNTLLLLSLSEHIRAFSLISDLNKILEDSLIVFSYLATVYLSAHLLLTATKTIPVDTPDDNNPNTIGESDPSSTIETASTFSSTLFKKLFINPLSYFIDITSASMTHYIGILYGLTVSFFVAVAVSLPFGAVASRDGAFLLIALPSLFMIFVVMSVAISSLTSLRNDPVQTKNVPRFLRKYYLGYPKTIRGIFFCSGIVLAFLPTIFQLVTDETKLSIKLSVKEYEILYTASRDAGIPLKDFAKRVLTNTPAN